MPCTRRRDDPNSHPFITFDGLWWNLLEACLPEREEGEGTLPTWRIFYLGPTRRCNYPANF